MMPDKLAKWCLIDLCCLCQDHYWRGWCWFTNHLENLTWDAIAQIWFLFRMGCCSPGWRRKVLERIHRSDSPFGEQNYGPYSRCTSSCFNVILSVSLLTNSTILSCLHIDCWIELCGTGIGLLCGIKEGRETCGWDHKAKSWRTYSRWQLWSQCFTFWMPMQFICIVHRAPSEFNSKVEENLPLTTLRRFDIS